MNCLIVAFDNQQIKTFLTKEKFEQKEQVCCFCKDKKIEQTKHFGKDEGAAFDAWGKMKFHLQRHHGRDGGKILRVVIKDYFDGVEKIIRKHKDTMGKIFYGYAKSKRQTEDSWDEQLVNNIKIKKVHVLEVKSYEDDEYVVHDDVSSVGN